MNKPEIIKSILAEKAKKKPLLEAWREAIDKGGVVLVRKYIRAMAYADLRRLVRALDDYDLLRLARAMGVKLDGKRPNPK
jgi:hypothetical protein